MIPLPQYFMMENDNHLEQSSKDSKSQPSDYLHITQNTPNPSVPGEAKLAHLEHRPPSEGLKTRVSVPGECQERKYTHSTVRNGKEIAVLFPLRARNDVFSSFCVRNGTGMQILFPLRTDSKRVAQLMCLGVKYNGDRVRHRLGK